jgi:hypothetical protein
MSTGTAAPIVITPRAQTPAEPEDYKKLKEEFEKVATSKIGRWVSAGIALMVPVLTALCAWLQKKIGINLDPAALTAFITSMAAGIAITGFKWLSNRGDWERLAVEGYQVYLTGQAASAPTNQVVIAPPAAGATIARPA